MLNPDQFNSVPDAGIGTSVNYGQNQMRPADSIDSNQYGTDSSQYGSVGQKNLSNTQQGSSIKNTVTKAKKAYDLGKTVYSMVSN